MKQEILSLFVSQTKQSKSLLAINQVVKEDVYHLAAGRSVPKDLDKALVMPKERNVVFAKDKGLV